MRIHDVLVVTVRLMKIITRCVSAGQKRPETISLANATGWDVAISTTFTSPDAKAPSATYTAARAEER